MALSARLQTALDRRKSLIEQLTVEQTDAYRIFHGTTEGVPGLTIDRYGSLILVQSFREPLSSEEFSEIELFYRKTFPGFSFAYNHRGKGGNEGISNWYQPGAEMLREYHCREFGVQFLIRPRHQGIDPWLFLDLRAGRRYLRERIKGKTLLNLFSYTCSVGVSAAEAGAAEVWNVDFASSNLEVGRRNAALNSISEDRFQTIEENCLPVMRQLAGLPPGVRHGKNLRFRKFAARQFDFVFLDPPAWSKGPFGAVDVAGDYPSLFKPALLATRSDGGTIIATNHVPSIDFESWAEILKRCALKAGRPIKALHSARPDEDFPSFDGRPPLKIAICEV